MTACAPCARIDHGWPAPTAASADDWWRSCALMPPKRCCGWCRPLHVDARRAGTPCRRRRRHADRIAGARRVGGRAAEKAILARCSAPGNPRCSRCRRGRRSMPPTTARPAGSRRPRRTRRARCRSSSSTSRRKSARWTRRSCARASGHAAQAFEVHPGAGILAAQRRARADRAEEGQKPRSYEPGLALGERLLIAAGLPDDVVNAPPPKGRGGRRPARCAGLRRHRAADPCRRRSAFPRSAAAARRIPDWRWRSGHEVC